MTLSIPERILTELIAAAREAMPEEACGFLAGTGSAVNEFYPVENTDHAADHFTMRPEDQFRCIKDMRTKQIKSLAIWHSHPETPARMSEEDLRLAYTPDAAYLILSLQDPDNPVMKGFVVNSGSPSEITINEASSPSKNSSTTTR